MAREIVDIAHPEISSSGVSKELDTVVSLSLTERNPKTAVKTMNRRRRALGFTRGVKEIEIELTVVVPFGTPDVDWDALSDSAEEFLLSWEEGDGGRRRSAIDCVVTETSSPFSEDGELRKTVSLMALDLRSE